MNKRKYSPVKIVAVGAIIAAVYAAATYAAAAFGLAYGNVQFRFSEALCVLPAFTPLAIPGLTVGCFLGNIGSPYGMIDVICGTSATLIAAILGYMVRNIKWKGIPFLVPLPAVLVNAVIVGLEITVFAPSPTPAVFLISALEVGIGQLVVCYALGLPLYAALNNKKVAPLLK